MATVMEAISMVRSAFKLVDADNIISNRMVYSELRAALIKLVKQRTDKRQLYSSSNIFTELTCLTMEEVPLSSCCDYTSECKISRTIARLPAIAESIYGPLIQGVYSIDGSRRFDYMDPDRYANTLRLYNKPQPTKCWLKNGHIYTTDPNLESINVLAFFVEDITPGDYSCSGAPDCPDNPLYQEFKCPPQLLKDTVDMARQVIERDYKRSLDDKTVDNNDQSK